MASDRPPDERPRPQYGELAPEGWSWQPPADTSAGSQNPPPPPPGQQPTAAPWGGAGAGSAAGGRAAAAAGPPAWDTVVTIILLAVGILGTFLAISILGALPQAIQVLYTQEGLGTYTPAASVASAITAGSITEAGVWLVSAIVSVLLLVRGKRAFYVPLIGGVIGFVVIFVFLSLVLTTDPTLFDYFSRP